MKGEPVDGVEGRVVVVVVVVVAGSLLRAVRLLGRWCSGESGGMIALRRKWRWLGWVG
jgi:hypothetical protein